MGYDDRYDDRRDYKRPRYDDRDRECPRRAHTDRPSFVREPQAAASWGCRQGRRA